ncbi:MAG: 5-oxoprolinase subunit PxpB [Burkholderiales bacterium]
MAKATWRIAPQGDRCLMVEFGQKVDRETNLRARALAQYLVDHPLPGVLDVVPAFTSVAIHYRPEALVDPAGNGLPYDWLAARVEQVLQAGVERKAPAQRRVEIPVCYGGDFGPDLEEIARARKVTPDELITIHSRSPHVVYMLGFAPGFPYIAGLDERLAMPRRATPRLKIPLGTIAIAGGQSVVYTLETPGGWNLIGRTPLRVFTPETDPPCLLRAGDAVHFVPITLAQYQAQHDAAARRA